MVLFRKSFASLSRTSFALIAMVAFALASVACQAPESVMLGAQGEFCNGTDADCQSGLRCHHNVCSTSDGASGDDCTTICERLDDCDASLSNCVNACQNEITNWRTEIIDAFRTCFTDDFSCEDLRAEDDPAQACYNELPALPAEREQRCSDFHTAANNCGAEEDGLTDLRNACRKAARTLNEETWSFSDACVERLADNVCPDIADCLNEVYALNPQLTTSENGSANAPSVDVNQQSDGDDREQNADDGGDSTDVMNHDLNDVEMNDDQG